ncbi:neurochondrin [Impatiens glandulifera]|uniref:neurochondrin n=1 Tax=Impatiens glandulifera TaxID=253017 RepID=UPI001FB115D1|nr:neurochondrin [Impatiens glandulifera]
MQPQEHQSSSESSPSLDDCLKLLKGERDEQRLAGLLLVTKLCDKDDHTSIRKVYDAIGDRFLDRLLRTGMGEGSANSNKSDNHDAYLQLAVMVLAVFCRVSDIASSKYMLSKVPLVLEIMSKGLGSCEECLEILFLVLSANEAALVTICESGGLRVLASNIYTLPEGTHSLELAIRLVRLIISMPLFDTVYNKYASDLAVMVAAIGKQLAELHSMLKFEALHILSAIVSSMYSESLHHALCSMKDDSWPGWIRQGVVAILQNRVAPTEKLRALILVEFTISIVGEQWFIGPTTLGSLQEPVPPNRCLLLVLESSRVEIAVLLNELAYLKYEVSQHSSSIEGFVSKKRNLAVVFSLVEKIIKFISNIAEEEGDVFDESTFSKIITGLNETMDVVLEYLKDAKEHGRSKGDELLASVRVLGSYLAETPLACKEKVEELLGYMLSVESEDESSPLYSVCFLLPMLCQITMNSYGCKILASSGAYKAVVEYLIKLIDCGEQVGDLNSIFLACDTVMNFLLKREEIQVTYADTCFIYLLRAMTRWAGNTADVSILMMASSICALILDLTSESILLESHEFNYSDLQSLSKLIAKSLAIWKQEKMVTGDAKLDVADLHQIITSGYSRWSNRFPHIRVAVES